MSRKSLAAMLAATVMHITGAAAPAFAETAGHFGTVAEQPKVTVVVYALTHNIWRVPTAFPAQDKESCLKIISGIVADIDDDRILSAKCVTDQGVDIWRGKVDRNGQLLIERPGQR